MDKDLISALWGLLLLLFAILPSILQLKKNRDLARRKTAGMAPSATAPEHPAQGQNTEHADWHPGQTLDSTDYGRHENREIAASGNPDRMVAMEGFGSIDFSAATTRKQGLSDEKADCPQRQTDSRTAHRGHKIPAAGVSPEGVTDCENGPLDDFNLRHAVLYAEILKPKFGPQSDD